VFYFFKRGSETVQCEVRSESDGPGYEIVITDPRGVSRVEHFATSDQVHDRWMELHRRFENDGWWGPAAGWPRIGRTRRDNVDRRGSSGDV
jgi:hypothetical protein